MYNACLNYLALMCYRQVEFCFYKYDIHVFFFLFRSKPVLIVHGEKGPSQASLQADAMGFDNIRFCQVTLHCLVHTWAMIFFSWFSKFLGHTVH